MSKKIYALLVGINQYHPESYPTIPALQGCHNDVFALRNYLQERINSDEYSLVEPDEPDLNWILLDQAATRQAVVDGFLKHLCQATSDDIVLFFFAGHGAQEKASEQFWDIEPDHLNETLVCYDSRTEGSWDLADKELAYLIAQVAQKQPHIVVILDCCHAGSGTRAPSETVLIRSAPMELRQRSEHDFLFTADPAFVQATVDSLTSDRSNFVLPEGNHILLAACRDYQTAKEYRSDNHEPRGAFSCFLLQALQRSNSTLSYRDLIRNTNALIRSKVKEQSPQVEASYEITLDQDFIGENAIPSHPRYFVLRQTSSKQWMIDGGSLHGIPNYSENSNISLIILPSGDYENLRQRTQILGEAEIADVLPHESRVRITKGQRELLSSETYWAILTSLPIEKLRVCIRGATEEVTGVQLIEQCLQQANFGQPSLYLSIVESLEVADFQVLVGHGQFQITSAMSDRLIIAPIPNQTRLDSYRREDARQVVQKLEQIARWTNILNLSSPITSRLKPTDIEMQIEVLKGEEISVKHSGANHATASAMQLEYVYDSDQQKWQFPIIQVTLINHSQQTLYCNIFDLAESYAVGIPFFKERSSIRIPPNSQVRSDRIGLVIPDEYREQNITEYQDIFKLMVSTHEFDASLLEQQGLEVAQRRSGATLSSALNRLMAQIYTREAIAIHDELIDDWTTQEVAITIVYPMNAERIIPGERTVLHSEMVEILPHPVLQAKARLSSLTQVARDGENVVLPTILQDDPLIQPFQFTASRGSDPGLSVLEIFDVQNSTTITREMPLKLLIDASLREDHLLAVAYDGEFFLPIGRGIAQGAKTEILVHHLPSGTPSRSLGSALRIFFRKVTREKLGQPFEEYPVLAAAQAVKNAKSNVWDIQYETDGELLKAKVAQAQKILLYVHGIIGDTKSMLPSFQTATTSLDEQLRSLQEHYDLVLAFDYDSLNTDIRETARLLEKKLVAIGLNSNHGKELRIVAHSMGGLICRWFIEYGEGQQIVQHLVMLGTPNAGSPWAVVQDWAFTALTLGLNQLPSIVWGAKIIAQLLDFLDCEATKALDQMQPKSEVLRALSEGQDPHIQYTIIAGDRSLAKAALEQHHQASSPIQRLLAKLRGQVVDTVVDAVFFQVPNDIAVSLSSIKSIPVNRSPQPIFLEPDVACDHLTYFTHPAGLAALADVLLQQPNPSEENR